LEDEPELIEMIDETTNVEEGPIKIVDPETVSKEPKPLPENYEWVTMDLTDEKEVTLSFCQPIPSF